VFEIKIRHLAVQYLDRRLVADVVGNDLIQQLLDEGGSNRNPESSDILLHLAGVNEYRGLRVVGDAIWKACCGSHQFDEPRGS
jgi:hypothetical protein